MQNRAEWKQFMELSNEVKEVEKKEEAEDEAAQEDEDTRADLEQM